MLKSIIRCWCYQRKFTSSFIKHPYPRMTSTFVKNSAILDHQNNCYISIPTLSSHKSILLHCQSFSSDSELGLNSYHKISDMTLDHLTEIFENLQDSLVLPAEYDVQYSSGILTVKFGKKYGTYVLNKQTPNRQIWLSSPTSGPKRYDYQIDRKEWIYKHDNTSMFQLLNAEISVIVSSDVDFYIDLENNN